MTVRMEQLVRCIAMALDAVEGELLGASTHHGKRIATLTATMARHLGWTEEDTFTLAACALLHDNALTEYILSERPGKYQALNMRIHCEIGERNVRNLPFPGESEGLVLFHHERADGKGPFGKVEGQIPLGAALIAIADTLDARLHLQRYPVKALPALRERIVNHTGTEFTSAAADAMLAVLDEPLLLSLRDDKIHETVADVMPSWEVEVDGYEVIRLTGFAARIIDYKSVFTKEHSVRLANMAWVMSGYYGFAPQLRAKVYLAAGLHDLGKLYVPTEILEKPGSLTDEEFEVIKTHVHWTHELLKDISGFEDVCRWASNHHEKLNGSGYTGGAAAEELDFVSRLMTCMDIYQAVREERPYHRSRSHDDTIVAMQENVGWGEIDPLIVHDIDLVMREFRDGMAPSPPGAVM